MAVDALTKRFGKGKAERTVLDAVSLRVEPGELVAIVGPSGCGKSTLLGILGGLDRAFEGEVRLFGRDVRALSDGALSALRGRRIGFVFQAFHLLPHLTALDNVLAPSLFRKVPDGRAGEARLRARAERLLADVGLPGRGSDVPAACSGGERQRIAVARALLLEPELLLCDEPSGNLDVETGGQIIDIFAALHRDTGLTVVVVTHDEALAARAGRVLGLRRGRLEPRPGASAATPDERRAEA
ncbi:MAG: ABC transporter ATP-binding protein [Polyangiaceae bacterium]|nr:ABC transporter ATP-binding protein [Polyangiaceae bacterium]